MAGTGALVKEAVNDMVDMVQYCYNPKTKEIVEGKLPPNKDFVPIIGYFPRTATNPLELQKMIEEIASRYERDPRITP